MVKKHPGGRPTKYRPEMCNQIVSLMEQGYSKEATAGHFGVSTETFYRWLDEIPEFRDAEKLGTSKSRLFWERKGMQGTFGELEKFNAPSWIFNMKNRFGWRDLQQVEHTGSMQATININLNAPPGPALPTIDGEYEMIEAPDEQGD